MATATIVVILQQLLTAVSNYRLISHKEQEAAPAMEMQVDSVVAQGIVVAL